MENTVIKINSDTQLSHDWGFFEELGFSKTDKELILPKDWLIVDEPFKRLKSLKPCDSHNRSVAVLCSADGVAEKVIITNRYYIRLRPGFHSNNTRVVCVYDKKEAKVIFATEECKKRVQVEKINFEKCREFLKLNYPNFEDPSAYWND